MMEIKMNQLNSQYSEAAKKLLARQKRQVENAERSIVYGDMKISSLYNKTTY